MKHWMNPSIKDEKIICQCGEITENILGICDKCLDRELEDNIIENGELIEDEEVI